MSYIDALEDIHAGLPRQGVGSEETAKTLFDAIKHPHKIQRAIDMGCGTGRSTIWLAEHGIHTVAVDIHQPFLNVLRKEAIRANVADRLDIQNMSIDNVPYPDESFDLVWSEGAAYFIGWAQALSAWKHLLKPDGYLIATDMFWTTDKPSHELSDFFKNDNVLALEQAIKIARQSGYSVIKIYIQPDSDWFDEYYHALGKRAEKLSQHVDPATKQAADMAKREIAIRHKYAGEYEHVGFVLQSSQ